MSVMQKLRAIRERMSALSVAHDEHRDPGSEVEALVNEVAAESSAANGAGAEASAQRSPTSTASMWDIAGETVEEQPDIVPAPDAEDPDSEIVRVMNAVERDFGSVQPEEPEEPEEREEPETTSRQSGRIKTRLLNFEHANGKPNDIFEKSQRSAAARGIQYPVGWVVVIRGPGRGTSVAIQPGVSRIGRDDDQGIQLDFGDSTISRSNHAAIAFDEDERTFYIGHGGKTNIVRLNGKPLLSTEALSDGDEIRVGQTTLRLVTLCGEAFSWNQSTGKPDALTG